MKARTCLGPIGQSLAPVLSLKLKGFPRGAHGKYEEGSSLLLPSCPLGQANKQPWVNSGTTRALTGDVYSCPGFLGRTERPEEGRHQAGKVGWYSRWDTRKGVGRWSPPDWQETRLGQC